MFRIIIGLLAVPILALGGMFLYQYFDAPPPALPAKRLAPGSEPPAVEVVDRQNKQFDEAEPLIGTTVEDLTALDENGNKFDFENLRGKYAVISFGCLT